MSIEVEDWRSLFNKLSVKITPTCGLCYELYQRRLSSSIDGALKNVNEVDKIKILEIARNEFDYLSADDIEECIKNDKENGICKHGLEFDCCPLGCGEE